MTRSEVRVPHRPPIWMPRVSGAFILVYHLGWFFDLTALAGNLVGASVAVVRLPLIAHQIKCLTNGGIFYLA